MAEEKFEAVDLSEKAGHGDISEPADKEPVSKDEFISENNRLDREFNLPITGSRTAKWYALLGNLSIGQKDRSMLQ